MKLGKILPLLTVLILTVFIALASAETTTNFYSEYFNSTINESIWTLDGFSISDEMLSASGAITAVAQLKIDTSSYENITLSYHLELKEQNSRSPSIFSVESYDGLNWNEITILTGNIN